MNNVVNINTYRKNKPKYVFFLFGSDMPITILSRQSLWFVDNGNYYELMASGWIKHTSNWCEYFAYENLAVDIIEAFELNKLKSVMNLNVYNKAVECKINP